MVVLLVSQSWSTGWGQSASFSGAQTSIGVTGLSSPLGVAIDSGGNLYVADSANNRVVKEAPSANGYTQSLVATGLLAPTGVAVDVSGNVYIADTQNNRVLIETLNAGAYTQAVVDSNLNSPSGVAVDSSGNVYVTDTQNNRAVKETVSAGVYTQSVIATGLNNPEGITVDQTGNIFIVNSGVGAVIEETPSSGAYTQTTAFSLLDNLAGITVDARGNLYLADSHNNQIVKLTPQASGPYTYAYSSTPLGSAGLSSPWGVAVNASGDVYVSDSKNNRVVELISKPTFGTVNVGTASPALSLIFTFSSAGSIAAPAVLTKGVSGLDFVDAGTGSCTTNGPSHSYSSGSVCTVDVVFTPRVPGLRPGAVVLSNVAGARLAFGFLSGTGLGPQASFQPYTQSTIPYTAASGTSARWIAFDAGGDIFMDISGLSNASGNALVEETPNGNGYTQTTLATGFNYVVEIALDGAGDIFLADQDNQTVYEEIPNGSGGYTQTKPFGSLGVVEGVATDSAGNVYVASELLGLLKYTFSNGAYSRTVINSAEATQQLAVDGMGRIYAMSTTYNDLYTPQANGTYTTSTLPAAYGFAVDLNGDIYVAEPFTTTLLKETPSGGTYVATTISTAVSGPVALDDSGNLYAIAAGSGALLKFDLADPPSLIFAATTVGSTSSNSPQTVTLVNTGNAPLLFPVPGSGVNPSITANFSLNSGSGSACPLMGVSSSTATLASEASCQLPVSYAPAAATPTSGALVVTDNSLNAAAPAYATQQISLGVSGSQTTPVINWATPVAIVYGTPLTGLQLNATSSVPGSFAYTPAGGTVLGAGPQTLSVALTPTNTSQYADASATTSIQVAQAKPVIAWAAPTAITYGTALSGTQLNATASVAGSFNYTPALGTVLGAGSQTLSVTFTPTDAVDYASVTSTVPMTVNAATPAIIWATPAAITYGTALSATQLNATSSIAGTFTYSPSSGVVLGAGNHLLDVTFIPTDTTDYTTAYSYVYITVNQAAPVVTWATPPGITYGTPLTNAQLNATANVPGYFIYSPAQGSIQPAGTDTLNVTFYPSDYTDYANATQTVSLTVNQATPAITWSTPAPVSYGTTLSSTQLNASANVAGTFTYTPAAGTTPPTGTAALSVLFTPTDTRDYTAVTQSVSLAVNKATPSIAWATPAAITYGTALTASQLNATASTPGTFTYSPASATLLSAGPQNLSVTFTPTDTADYVATTGSVSLTVNKAPLALTANSVARVFGTPNPAFTGTVSGTVNGDTFTESFTTAATTASIVGNYMIVPSVTGTNLADYAVTSTSGSLTVSQAGTSTTFALSNQNLTLTATVASLTSGTPTGSVGFYEGQTLVGTGTLTNGVATYTASSFPAGDLVVSAEYSGDANFTESSSPPILFLTVLPATTSLSASKGASVTDTLNVSVAPGYAGSLQFTCSGLPTNSTCTFQPASISFSGTTNTASVAVTIATDTASVASEDKLPFATRRATAFAALFWLPSLLLIGVAERRRKMPIAFRGLITLFLFCGLASMLTACSSSPATPQTPAGSSNIQIVASGASGLAQTTSLTLTVQ